MKTVVVISGKGGAGKTSVTAGLLPFLPHLVVADADVDASNLPLLLDARQTASEEQFESVTARILPHRCSACQACVDACRFEAITTSTTCDRPPIPRIDPLSCEGCRVCGLVCPDGAIAFHHRLSGIWYRSETPFGPISHACLSSGGENSGALVAKVREEAEKIASETEAPLILVDGPPGIGCPTISALTGADLTIVVTEPTPSGESDMKRALELARHFGMPAAVVINKVDLSTERAQSLATEAGKLGAEIIARFPYSEDVGQAIRESRVISTSSQDWHNRFEKLWHEVETLLGRSSSHSEADGGEPTVHAG